MENDSRNELSIIWIIENFSLRFLRRPPYEGELQSPRCVAENLDNSRFSFELNCKSEKPGGKARSDKYLFCTLHSFLDDDLSIPIECTMEIIGAGGETLQSKTFPKYAVKDYQNFEWRNIMKIDELVNKMKNWAEDTLTVRCHIFGEVKTRQPKIECEARTKIGVDRCSFLWSVEKPNTSDWFETKIFFFHDRTAFEITLSAPEDDVIINIRHHDSLVSFVRCRMSLVDREWYERYSQSANYLFSANNDAVWKFPTFFTKTQVVDEESTFSFGGRFRLTCNFSVPNGSKIDKVKYRTLPLENSSCNVSALSSLQDDWRGMFTSKKYADVKLRLDSEIFPAHKSLLAARSKVFSAMFDQDMLESRTGYVDIEDLDAQTMNSFLEFLYTGTVDDMDYENASKLSIAAEKYQVLSLKEKCASFLISNLSEENVCEALTLADMVRHELLKAHSLDYIRSHAGNILSSPQWLKWIDNNFKLASEIFCLLTTDITSGK